MTKTEKTKNILEIADMFDYGLGYWWWNNDDFPSAARINTFITNKKEWKKWVDDNLEIENYFCSGNNSEYTLQLTNCVATHKLYKGIVINWSVSQKDENLLRISSLYIRFNHKINRDFNIYEFSKQFDNLKILEEKKSKIYMVVQTSRGLDLQSFDIDVPEMDIEMNYGEEWKEKHKQLKDILTFKRKKGIALLHGLPGTGKSMYIRNLISSISHDKTVVYLPNQLIRSITDPSFIPLMAEYSGSVLVIEDADEAIRARKNGGATVDKLLNLSDGILSDFLNMQIICTFNSDIATIDEALLRKGRLILKHKFDKLSIEQSQKLSDHLGFKTEIKQPMTLAEIYNQDDSLADVNVERQKIGF